MKESCKVIGRTRAPPHAAVGGARSFLVGSGNEHTATVATRQNKLEVVFLIVPGQVFPA